MLAFDVFGTVVDWRGGITTELDAIARERKVPIDAATIADAWRRRYGPALDRVRRGEVPWALLDDLHRASLRQLVGELSIEALTEADIDRLVLAWHHLPAWPDAVTGLNRLRQRYILTTLSNGGVALLVDLARGAGLPFDCILSAELVRTYKPDPRTYQLVPELLAVRPEHVLMVAAHPDDLHAAAAAGLRSAFVPRPQEWGTGKAEAPAFPVDIEAEDFIALASKLGV